MRRYTLTFFRDEEPVAKLLLNLRKDKSVESWEWEGDSSACEALASSLPNNDQRIYGTWYSRADAAAQREGLTFTSYYEGEPFPEYDRLYAPDDPNGPAFKNRAVKR